MRRKLIIHYRTDPIEPQPDELQLKHRPMACGHRLRTLWGWYNLSTSDPYWVDCKRCRRTRAHKEAAAGVTKAI